MNIENVLPVLVGCLCWYSLLPVLVFNFEVIFPVLSCRDLRDRNRDERGGGGGGNKGKAINYFSNCFVEVVFVLVIHRYLLFVMKVFTTIYNIWG